MEDPRLRLRVSAKAWEEARHELPKRAERMVDQGRLSREQAGALLADGLRIAEARAAEVPPEAFAAFEEEAAYRIPRERPRRRAHGRPGLGPRRRRGPVRHLDQRR